MKFYQRLFRVERSCDNDELRGFIVGESDELLMLHYLAGMQLNGFMVLSKGDITNIYQSKIEVFQTKLLIEDKQFEQVRFDLDEYFDLTNWRRFFKSLKYPYLTIEEEEGKYPCLYLGKVNKVKKKKLIFHEFTGIARWEDDMTKIYYKDITCVRFDDSYTNAYRAYFRS